MSLSRRDLPQSQIRRAVIADAAMFFFMGFASSSWVSRLPAVRDSLNLSPTQIGAMLLIGSIGSLVALPSSGPVVGAIGPRMSGRLAGALWAMGLGCVVASIHVGSLGLLSLSLIFVSMGMSLTGSTINTAGGLIEVALGHPILDRFHAMFSIGTVTGALSGAAMARAAVHVTYHLLGVIVFGLICVAVATAFLLTEDDVLAQSVSDGAPKRRRIFGSGGSTARTRKAWGEKRTLLIGLMVLSSGLLEGSANNWLALAMVDGYDMTAAQGSAVLSGFLATVVVVRLSAAWLRRHWPPDVLLRGMLIAACPGLILVGFAPVWGIAMIGVVLWAFGAALVYPTGASALSHDPSMTAARLSVLSTINYGAFLIGPPVLGLLASHIGYHRALTCLVVPVAVGAWLTRYLRPESDS